MNQEVDPVMGFDSNFLEEGRDCWKIMRNPSWAVASYVEHTILAYIDVRSSMDVYTITTTYTMQLEGCNSISSKVYGWY